MTKPETPLQELLLETYSTPVSGYDGIYTKTTQFLLKGIKIDLRKLPLRNFFINAYINDKNYNHDYKTPVFLLFGVDEVRSADWFFTNKELCENPNYITDYEVGISIEGKSLIMFVFDFPFVEDYYHFKAGRYSRFTDEYRKLFPKKIVGENGKEQESLIWGIIHKSLKVKNTIKEEFNLTDEDIKDIDEYWDIPRKEREVYNYGKEKVPCSS